MGTPSQTTTERIFHLRHHPGRRRVIRINPALDQPFVPLWFLQYVLYHEMLHSVVPDEELPGGRRRVHTEEFNRREREFRGYGRARRWEEDNLAKFLHKPSHS